MPLAKKYICGRAFNMPTICKIFLPERKQTIDGRPILTLYRASGEDIFQGPEDILKLLRVEGVVLESNIRAINPITHSYYSCVVTLAPHRDAVVALSAAVIPGIIAWLKTRKGRKIEIRIGVMKISAPNARALQDTFQLLDKHKQFIISVSKAVSKGRKHSSK